MSSLVKGHRESLLIAIEILVTNLATSVNVKFNIEPEQLPDIARAIYNNYYFYSIEEVALILRKGSEGEMGKIYDRLSKDMILDWFKIYDEKYRSNFIHNSRIEQDREFKEVQEEVIKLLGGENNIGRMIEQLKKEEDGGVDKEQKYKEFKENYFKNKNKENL